MWWIGLVQAAPLVAERVEYAEEALQTESRGIVLVGMGASLSGRFEARHGLTTTVPGVTLGELADCAFSTWQPVTFDCSLRVDGWSAHAARVGADVFAVEDGALLLKGIRSAVGTLTAASADEQPNDPAEPKVHKLIGVRQAAEAVDWGDDPAGLDAALAASKTTTWHQNGEVSPTQARPSVDAMMSALADDIARCVPQGDVASFDARVVVTGGRVVVTAVGGLPPQATACVSEVLNTGQMPGSAEVQWTWTAR